MDFILQKLGLKTYIDIAASPVDDSSLMTVVNRINKLSEPVPTSELVNVAVSLYYFQ